MNNIKIRGFQKKVSDSDFGFQVGINEHFCFPNLFFLFFYISTALNMSIFEVEQFSFLFKQVRISPEIYWYHPKSAIIAIIRVGSMPTILKPWIN